MTQIPNCCNRQPRYLIIYRIDDSQYLVCDECIKIEHWSRNILSKQELPLPNARSESSVCEK